MSQANPAPGESRGRSAAPGAGTPAGAGVPAGADEWAQPVRALVFDVDDTLIDTQAAMRESCRVGARAAWPQQDDAVHVRIAEVFYDDVGGFFDAYTRGEMDFPTMRAARYARSMQEVGLPDEGFATFESTYLRHFATCQVLFDDVLPLFDRAAERGVAVALLTNSGDEQTALKLEAVGLTGRFPVVTTDTLGVGKPDPRLFAASCDLTGVGPAETLFVGDTLPTDVVGARGAGMRVAWLQRPDRPEPRNAGWGTPVEDPGVRVIAGLDQVTALL